MNTELDKMKDRIRKLFALANDKAATEDEAAAALKIAMGLMAKYGIEQASISDKPLSKAMEKKLAEAIKDYQITIISAAATLYGCKVIVLGRGKAGVEIFGREENVEATHMTALWLGRQLESFYKQALPSGLSQKERSEFRRTFKQACATRVSGRAWRMYYDMTHNTQTAQEATGKNALVVLGHFDQMFAEADAAIASKYGKVKEVTRKSRAGSGTMAGLQAGDQVKLRRELS